MIKTLNDYLDIFYKKYPEIPKEDIVRILKFGWRAYYLCNSYGGDVLVKNSTSSFWTYTGNLRKDSVKHMRYYIKTLTTKLRILYARTKLEYDGYYYFALSDEKYKNYLLQVKLRGRPKKHFNMGNVILYKIYDECSIKHSNDSYIFRVKVKFPSTFTIYRPNYVATDPELIVSREPLKFKDILTSTYNYKYI